MEQGQGVPRGSGGLAPARCRRGPGPVDVVEERELGVMRGRSERGLGGRGRWFFGGIRVAFVFGNRRQRRRRRLRKELLFLPPESLVVEQPPP